MPVKLISTSPLLFQNPDTGETSDNPVDIGGTVADLETALKDISGVKTAVSNPVDDKNLHNYFDNNFELVKIQNKNKLFTTTVELDGADSVAGRLEKRNNRSGKAVNSIFDKEGFNGYASSTFSGGTTKQNPDDFLVSSSPYSKDSDNEGSSNNTNKFVNPTASNIVENFGNKESNAESTSGYKWSYADFLFCKYFGKISNNYLITLRKFAIPAPDDIKQLKTYVINPKDGSVETDNNLKQPALAQACTFMGEDAGNSLKDIFKFKVGFNWQKVESQLQNIEGGGGQKGIFSGKIGQYFRGTTAGRAIGASVSGRDGVSVRQSELDAGRDRFNETYPNFIHGPLNVIKEQMIQDRGLVFEQSFNLTFEYELRSFESVDGREAFLNLLSSLLLLTYAKAPFWGGDVRYFGNGYVGNPLLDQDGINALVNGDFTKVKNKFKEGVSTYLKNSLGTSNLENVKIGDVLGAAGSIFKNFAQLKLTDLFKDPVQSQQVAAQITGDPTGFWHLTIGNPFQPFMMVGNLILEDAEFEFDGPLSFNDTPTKLKMIVTLKHGRPRDRVEIERMFNFGKEGLLHPISDAAFVNDGSLPKISPYSSSKLHVKKSAN